MNDNIKSSTHTKQLNTHTTRATKFCNIHIQTPQEIGRFRRFHPSQILYILSAPKNLYLAWRAISYISSIPTWIRYLKQTSRSRSRLSLLIEAHLRVPAKQVAVLPHTNSTNLIEAYLKWNQYKHICCRITCESSIFVGKDCSISSWSTRGVFRTLSNN